MTDDVDLVRLLAHAEAAAAKVVLIGDHRQVGAVGPGGALQALVRRHPNAVHHLTGNRRQHDPDERLVLAELRDGDVTKAVSWYETHGRIHPVPLRDEARQAAVDAWAADIAVGQNAALFAWRRANVAALNEGARKWMQATGRLSGPELVCPGGLSYRAGDRVVTLAPGPNALLVTSQRATVQSVDVAAGTLLLRTDDDRTVALRATQAGDQRLGYGYATTVHRSPGRDGIESAPLRGWWRTGAGVCGHEPSERVHPRLDGRGRSRPGGRGPEAGLERAEDAHLGSRCRHAGHEQAKAAAKRR